MKKSELISINEIIILKDLYPRDSIREDTVKTYQECLDNLPPIIINQDKFLIDGAHRLTAYKNSGKQKIPCFIEYTEKNIDIYKKAVKTNSSHGRPLKRNERQKIIIKFYKNGLKEKEIANLLNTSTSVITQYLDLYIRRNDYRVERLVNKYFEEGKEEEEIKQLIVKKVDATKCTKNINDLIKKYFNNNLIHKKLEKEHTNNFNKYKRAKNVKEDILKTTWLYIIKDEKTDYYKIGISKNPFKRLSDLQTGNSSSIKIKILINLENDLNARSTEQHILQLLSPFKINGEWVDCPLSQIVLVINNVVC